MARPRFGSGEHVFELDEGWGRLREVTCAARIRAGQVPPTTHILQTFLRVT